MAEKHPTQAMPDDAPEGPPSGDNSRPEGAGGRPSSNRPTEKPGGGKFRGGQSVPDYYGPEQLGDEQVAGRENPNAAAKGE